MPLIRKLCRIGNGRAIYVPKSWVEFLEREHGKRIKEVAVEVNETLKITAILDDEEPR